MRKWLKRLALALVVALAAIQFVPYGRDHANPAVESEPNWDSPQTRQLVVVACFDCHSNETIWPWYSNVAPLSWLIQYDVDEGRKELNFSEWNRPQEEADEAKESVVEGEMPPVYYGWLHSAAQLSADEKNLLVQGLQNSLGR